MRSRFSVISPQKTSDEPMPSMTAICPTGSVRLAILISRSARVKQPIAAIIRTMLRQVRACRPFGAGIPDAVTHANASEAGAGPGAAGRPVCGT